MIRFLFSFGFVMVLQGELFHNHVIILLTAPLSVIFSQNVVRCLDFYLYRVEVLYVCGHVILCLVNQKDFKKYDNNKAFNVVKPDVAYIYGK